jgi:1-acyl-sn-glycerol-3-phosphate acyltransferase
MDVFEIIEQSGGRFNIEGLDNLRQDKDPVIIISNHMSTLETIIFPVLIAPIRKVTFIVKDNLVRARTFGPIMRSRNPIVVGRTNSRADLETVLRRGPELTSDGYSIIVFPQSTRYVDFDPATFNSLGVKLAKKAGIRVVPVAIKTDFWAIGKRLKDIGPIKRRRPIHIHFGEPMAISGNGREQHQQIIEFIQAKLGEWQEK